MSTWRKKFQKNYQQFKHKFIKNGAVQKAGTFRAAPFFLDRYPQKSIAPAMIASKYHYPTRKETSRKIFRRFFFVCAEKKSGAVAILRRQTDGVPFTRASFFAPFSCRTGKCIYDLARNKHQTGLWTRYGPYFQLSCISKLTDGGLGDSKVKISVFALISPHSCVSALYSKTGCFSAKIVRNEWMSCKEGSGFRPAMLEE
ncbi:MAG: hypothetical protein ACI33P_05965 [Lysinibacillus sp.]